MIYALLAVFAVLQIADIVTTLRALAHGGRELNPVVRWFMARLGRAGGLVAAKVVLTAITIDGLLYVYASNPTLVLIALVLLCAEYGWVVQHNWRQV